MNSKNNNNSLLSGVLSCNAGGFFGFVLCDDGDVFIAGSDMADALNGDTVTVRLLENISSRGHREGRIINIVSRGNTTVTGVIYKEKDGYFCVRPDSRKIYTKILVSPEDALDASIGQRVIVSSLDYSKKGLVFGEITEILGDENSLRGLTEAIIIGNNLKQEFDIETLREADKIPQTVSKKQLEGREDLREKLIFTIDGDDAKDFDDAVSLDEHENGNYILGVHIADVSEYVREKKPLDNEAFSRGTSVYLADRVIPMLPVSLSNGICSLNPNVDRLTLSCFMEIDKNGRVVNHRLSKTVIRSRERMTYHNVNILLEGNSRKLRSRYEYMLPTLCKMQRLAEILRNKRMRRGAIDFDFPECHIIMNDMGEPKDIVKEERGVSNRMIEEFMLAANETVAEYAFWSEIPFVYRSHEPPAFDKIKALNALLLRFGLQIKGKIDEDTPVKPKEVQRILDEAKETNGERTIAAEMLRSLMKAKYTDENLGHFGLAAKYYCHFTSPIRRYPDLAVHRILKRLIDGGDVNSMKQFTQSAAANSSEREVAAEQAERDVEDLMKAAYMSRYVGKDYDAVISNVTGYGMFAALDNTVEGLIRLENMTDDFYEFDEHTGVITGRRKGKTYQTGDNVRVVLARADILSRQIDFVLEEDADNTLRKFLPEKKASQPNRASRRKRTVKGKKSYKRKRRKHG